MVMEVSLTKQYDLNDVLNEIDLIKPQYKTRKREWIDKRNYLVGLLYYKFYLTEEQIASHFKIERSAINNAKRQPYSMIRFKDAVFMRNTLELSRKYPFNFTPTRVLKNKKINVVIHLDERTLKKLKKYQKFKGHINVSIAIEELVDFGLYIHKNTERNEQRKKM